MDTEKRANPFFRLKIERRSSWWLTEALSCNKKKTDFSKKQCFYRGDPKSFYGVPVLLKYLPVLPGGTMTVIATDVFIVLNLSSSNGTLSGENRHRNSAIARDHNWITINVIKHSEHIVSLCSSFFPTFKSIITAVTNINSRQLQSYCRLVANFQFLSKEGDLPVVMFR